MGGQAQSTDQDTRVFETYSEKLTLTTPYTCKRHSLKEWMTCVSRNSHL